MQEWEAWRAIPALLAVVIRAIPVGWIFLRHDSMPWHDPWVEIVGAVTYTTTWVIAAKDAFPRNLYLGQTWSLAVARSDGHGYFADVVFKRT